MEKSKMTICADCATNKGLIPKDKEVGLWLDTCPYCKLNTTVCDEGHDYKYPGQKPVTLEEYLTWRCNNPE